MTTSVINAEELQRLMTLPLKELSSELALKAKSNMPPEAPKPVSLQELFDRARELFTREEAEDLARRVEEGRVQRHD